MTETAAAAQPPMADPAPVALCTVTDAAGADDHTEGESREIVAKGKCWKHLQRIYRGQPLTGRPPDLARDELLTRIRAAYRRDQQAAARVAPAMEALRIVGRLAYADGLSLAQLATATSRGAAAVHKWIPRELSETRRVRPGQFGGDHATPATVDQWKGRLAEATDALAAARDDRRENRRQLVEEITEAMADTNPHRVGLERVAKDLGVAPGTVDEWLHPRKARGKGKQAAVKLRCQATKPGGGRCGAWARHHHSTCFHHRDQEGS